MKINQRLLPVTDEDKISMCSGPLEISMRVAEAREIEMLFFLGGG